MIYFIANMRTNERTNTIKINKIRVNERTNERTKITNERIKIENIYVR